MRRLLDWVGRGQRYVGNSRLETDFSEFGGPQNALDYHSWSLFPATDVPLIVDFPQWASIEVSWARYRNTGQSAK